MTKTEHFITNKIEDLYQTNVKTCINGLNEILCHLN